MRTISSLHQQKPLLGGQTERNRRVCLLLEGTYPYVFGGVSAWVDQILHEMPEREFELTFIGSRKAACGVTKYTLPENLGRIHEIYLHDSCSRKLRFTRGIRSRAREVIDLVRVYIGGNSSEPLELMNAVCDLASSCSLCDFWELQESWDLLVEIYEDQSVACSFKEFYWNMWNFVSHLWSLFEAIDRVPEAPVYHAVCTGYAGMLGALLKHRRGGKFLLSEHGIYVKERIEDLRTTSWIADPGERVPVLGTPSGVLTELWMKFFLLQAKVSYIAADQIVSLFERNAEIQVEFGADRKKIQIVPNGVANPDLADDSPSRRHRDRPVAGFLGRIVPIKDIKTLLRAIPTLLAKCPSAELLIAGPTDENPAYYTECLELTQALGLQDSVRFLGKVSAEEFLGGIDVMVLTSLSEGLPFALLEAFAFGIPAVASDVGACRELIHGREVCSAVEGLAGLVTPVAEPERTGEALAQLLNDSELRQKCGEIGRRRAVESYALRDVVSTYEDLYDC